MILQKKNSDYGTASSLFELPKAIAEQLRQCADESTDEMAALTDSVKYLWIHLLENDSGSDDKHPASELSDEEWLNVVDEAASLGVQYMCLCVDNFAAKLTRVLSICQWAQSTHGMGVGIHFHSDELMDSYYEELSKLDPDKTCVMLNGECAEASVFLKEKGIKPCELGPLGDRKTPPCEVPSKMICVGPAGTLYRCGLVLGDDRFRLGSVANDKFSELMQDGSVSEAWPGDTSLANDGCQVCPSKLEGRLCGDQNNQ